MTYSPQPNQLPTIRIPREADAKLYAEWAVRRIGRALSLGVFGPIACTFLAAIVEGQSDAAVIVAVLAGVVCVITAVLMLCFANAPD